MKNYIQLLTVFLLSTACFAQLSVRNDAYIFVDDTFVYVEDDINLKEANSTLFLRDEAQVLQGSGTTGNAGLGSLSVYQQGDADTYTYNYWCSPVGTDGTDSNGNAINNPFVVLNEATGLTTSVSAGFTGSYDGSASPLQIAQYWLWTFSPGTQYSEWDYAGNGSAIAPGYGFTMKGNASAGQIYDFRGKPNSGTIDTAVLNGQFTLVGNPYPSALDALEYIHDTNNAAVMTGTLYFWEQQSTSHVLTQYVGGYATYTIDATGTMETFTPAPFGTLGDDGFPVGGTTPSTSGKQVRRYIPIGQGFMIEGDANGNVQTKNEHRVYYKQSDVDSEFFKSGASNSNQKTSNTTLNQLNYDDNGFQILPDLPGIKRFRLNVDFNDFITRQLVQNFHPNATDTFDYGLESKNSNPNPKDAYFTLGDTPLIAEANNFNIDLKIPLVFKLDENMPIRVRLFDVQNFDSQPIYLHDKVTDVYYDLTNQNFEANLETGTYSDRFEITFTNGELLSTTEFEDTNFTVFQNNTQSQLVVSNPKGLNIKSLSLIDISGKQLFNKLDLKNNTRHEFSTKNLSDGVYIVAVTLENSTVLNKKVIISNK